MTAEWTAKRARTARLEHQAIQPKRGHRLSLMSYAVALHLTELPLREDIPLGDRLGEMQAKFSQIMLAAEGTGGDSGCVWLQGLGRFLQLRHGLI